MGSKYRFLSFIGVVSMLLPLTAQTAHAQSLSASQRAALEQQLQQVEAEIADNQAKLKTAQGQSASLSRDITVLDAKIKAAQLQIQAENLLIQTLGSDITQKQNHIDDLESRITAGKQTLAELMRKMSELDSSSAIQVMLSQKSVSGFFQDLDTFQSLQQGLQTTFDQLQADEASTSAEKDALTTRQNAEIDARHTIVVEQANIKADEQSKQQLLNISKGNEAEYSAIVTQKQAEAARIRSALFNLAGAHAIPFGDALNYATVVYQKTGVPQDFLLAILKQETNIGANVGTCFLTDTSNGYGVDADGRAIADVMKPSRDVKPFVAITSSLGLDYSSMPVSCPQSIGYGGGMGPAQFIASTWMLFKDRIAAAVGSATPNPWKPLDAFMAAGLYLADLGADSPSYSAQRNAACRYYSGQPCGYVYGSSSYGNNVMALADSIQQDINIIQD